MVNKISFLSILVFIALIIEVFYLQREIVRLSSSSRKKEINLEKDKDLSQIDSDDLIGKRNSSNLIIKQDLIDFENFDNKKGANKSIIPNIVHLLYLQQPYLKFYHLVNILSIYYNHNPKNIYIHCDNCDFKGQHFEKLKQISGLWNKIKFYKIPFADTIFGAKYGWVNHHRSDVWRVLLLMQYGGIFLDNDVYVIKSFKKYLKFEMVVSWIQPFEREPLGVQVLIAHKNARLLKAHYDRFRTDYNSKNWYYNGGYVPAEILREHMYMAHVAKDVFGTQPLHYLLYHLNSNRWKKFFSIHLMINHRFYVDKDSPIKEFDEKNIWNYNRTYGIMARDVLLKANFYVPKNFKKN